MAEFVKLLVPEAFNGHGVNDFFAESGEVLDGEFGGQGFSRAGVGGDEDVLSFNNGFNCIFLKITERISIQFKMRIIF